MTAAKRKLVEYAAMKKSIRRLNSQIAELEEMSRCIKTSTDFSRIKVKNSVRKGAPFEETVEKIDSLVRKKIDYIEKLIGMTEEVEELIAKINESVLREVLWFRYIKAMPIREIATRMSYSEQYIYELIRKALNQIEEK